jgi:hypothetical protein
MESMREGCMECMVYERGEYECMEYEGMEYIEYGVWSLVYGAWCEGMECKVSVHECTVYQCTVHQCTYRSSHRQQKVLLIE